MSPTTVRSWSPAGCSPTSPGPCPTKPVDVALDGAKLSRHLRQLALQPADHARRGLPGAARDARGRRHRRRRPVRRGRRARPSPPPAATTCSRSSPASSSRSTASTLSLLATDRFRLSLRELEWSPTQPDLTVSALVPARVLADTAKSLPAGSELSIALATGGAGEGLIGFESTAAGGQRRTTTRLIEGAFPNVRQLFPSTSEISAQVEIGCPDRRRSSGSRWSPAATPRSG